MRVLQIAPRYPPHVGGVETHVSEITRRLVDRGHEVRVHTADRRADWPNPERRDGAQIVRHHSLAPGESFHVAPGIGLSVATADPPPDIVHAHNYHSLPLVFAALGRNIGRLDGQFVCTTHYHGGSDSALRDHLLTAYQPVGRWAVRQADAVVAVSEWERDQLRTDFGVNAAVIPNGFDVDRFRTATPEERDRPYLLTVGRLEAYKGVQHAIRALPELEAEGYELVVVGKGDYREELERIARETGVADRVDFLGFVDDSRLPGLYAGATVHLQLSEFEAYGMTVGEALAAGTPCVVRTTAALSNWTAQTGVVGIDNPKPERVAAAVRRVADMTPEADSVADWDTVTDSLLDLYDRTAATPEG